MPRVKGGSKMSLVKVDYSSVKDVLVPYRRVSTREQADKGAGLDAQKTTLDFGMKLRGATPITWGCVDKGKSGKNLKREELRRALHIVEQGQAGGIIVSKLDRLSRSLLDFAFLMAKAQREGWNIVALDLGVDLSTPAGQMMAGILAVFAEFERNVISQRTRDGLAEKRAQGIVGGRRRRIDDDFLGSIVEAYVADKNFSAVARWLNESGVETVGGGRIWHPMVIKKMVESPDGQKMAKRFDEMAAA